MARSIPHLTIPTEAVPYSPSFYSAMHDEVDNSPGFQSEPTSMEKHVKNIQKGIKAALEDERRRPKR